MCQYNSVVSMQYTTIVVVPNGDAVENFVARPLFPFTIPYPVATTPSVSSRPYRIGTITAKQADAVCS